MRLRFPTDIDLLRPNAVLALTLGWAVVGLVAGSGTWLAAAWDGSAVGVREAYGAPFVAGMCWVPISIGAVLLVRRVPLRLPLTWRLVAPYMLSLLAVSFALNFGVMVIMAAMGAIRVSQIVSFTAADGLRWMHVNAGVFMVLVALAHLAKAHGAASRPSFRQTLQAESRGRTRLLSVDTIDWIGGASDYSMVHAAGREFLVNERLKTLETELSPQVFVRIHRSTIVNSDRIVELRTLGRGDREAKLECGATLRVARRRWPALERALLRREGKV